MVIRIIYYYPISPTQTNAFPEKLLAFPAMSLFTKDLTTMAAGAMGWAAAVPAVKVAGASVARSGGSFTVMGGALVVGIGIAYVTTPLLSYLLDWKTPNEKVRGVALVSLLTREQEKIDTKLQYLYCLTVNEE
jgi:hypothetical protein